MVRSLLHSAALFLLVLPGNAQAQLPTLDITTQPFGPDKLEVLIRPDVFFDGLFSSVVFTLRWEDASGVSLGDPLQNVPQVQYCSVFKSGGEQVQGPYRYQIFVGFGNITLSSLATSWTAGEEVVLCRIPIVGGATPLLMLNDAWTTANNGSYYVSLNGEDRTGLIYSVSTSVGSVETMAPSLAIHPNPASGSTRIALSTPQAVPDVLYRMLDAVGREVWTMRRSVPAGGLEEGMDLSGLRAGVYALEVYLPGNRLIQRLVIK